jgi:peptidoglycan-associated lipoprotein
MRLTILSGMGILGLILASAGCHKAAPVAAAKPPAPAPEPVQARSTPAPARTTPNRSVPATTQSSPQQPRNGQLSAAERATLNERLARMEDALFDYDKATIRNDATTALRDDVNVIRDILANYPQQKLVIEGHTDERGSDEYNMGLGDRRARAAEQFLSTMGIPQTQLTVISFGKEKPRCTEETEQCWQENRRAHITAAP